MTSLEHELGSNSRPIVPLERIAYPLGPIVSAFLDKVQTVRTPEGMVRSILYRQTSVTTDSKYACSAMFFPGMTLDGNMIGPLKQCDVMIVGKMPPIMQQFATEPADTLLAGGRSILCKSLEEAGISPEVYGGFYVTNMIRFPSIAKKAGGTTPKVWQTECYHYLMQELWLINPKYILCLGSEASTFFTNYIINKAQSHVFDYTLPSGSVAKVICAINPAAVVKNAEENPRFMTGIKLLADILLGRSIETHKANYEYIYSTSALEAALAKLQDKYDFALDCEWAGEHWLDDDAYIRTIQLGWSGADALVIVLRDEFGNNKFQGTCTELCEILHKFLVRRKGVRLVGHNIADDLSWLRDFGVDLLPSVFFDTMLAAHLFEPTTSHELKDLAVRYIPGWKRHDFELSAWMKETKFKSGAGFKDVPSKILLPYSAGDVCSTFLLFEHYMTKLADPQYVNLRTLFFEQVMRATPAFMEIEETGSLMDIPRMLEMQQGYRVRRDKLLSEFRQLIGNPTFNPESGKQKIELLFNELKLVPIKTTGKYPMMWDEVVSKNEQEKYTPATDDETLAALGQHSIVAAKLREICLLSTILKNFLQEPSTDDDTGERVYERGLMGVKRDGRLHTRISQMLKTGRVSTNDPNLSNMPKKQEGEVQKILNHPRWKLDGLQKVPKIRSVFMAEEGSLFVTCDYKQAEIAALAYLSGDETLIAAVESGQDVHSVVCKKMFKLDCPIKDIKRKYSSLRVAAKSLIFGILYGRGVKAVARAVEAEGTPCSLDEAKKFVADFMAEFPKVAALIQSTQEKAIAQGFVETAWGRREYFYDTGARTETDIARQKRMSFNFC